MLQWKSKIENVYNDKMVLKFECNLNWGILARNILPPTSDLRNIFLSDDNTAPNNKVENFKRGQKYKK